MWDRHKDRQTSQWKKNGECTNLSIHSSHLIYDKDNSAVQWEKLVCSTNGMR